MFAEGPREKVRDFLKLCAGNMGYGFCSARIDYLFFLSCAYFIQANITGALKTQVLPESEGKTLNLTELQKFLQMARKVFQSAGSERMNMIHDS